MRRLRKRGAEALFATIIVIALLVALLSIAFTLGTKEDDKGAPPLPPGNKISVNVSIDPVKVPPIRKDQ
ncbi:MAG: hypothetical protein V1735_07615 [Nanoarchaeota archaeon]